LPLQVWEEWYGYAKEILPIVEELSKSSWQEPCGLLVTCLFLRKETLFLEVDDVLYTD